ncbi:hypothetical protein HpRN3_12170 [Helicobacter pylori]
MIASLGCVEYFEGQCLAFLKNPQTNPQNEQYIPGVFSYQENKISFSFMVLGEIKEIHSLQYETLYIVDNKKRYTLYKPYNRIILGHVLGYPTSITLYYEWLFDDHIDPNKIKGECFVCRTNYLESFFTTKKHLLPDASFKADESGCESYHGDNDKNFILQSFYIQNDFLLQKYEKDKIKARSNSFFSERQNRLLTYQCDLFLECNMIFESLDKISLSRTKCDQTKNYFNDKCQEDLIKQIVDCRNSLAHGDDLKLDTNKATDISHVFMDFKQIVIEYFFGKIGLSDFITNNFGFLNKVKLRNPPKTEKIAEPNR